MQKKIQLILLLGAAACLTYIIYQLPIANTGKAKTDSDSTKTTNTVTDTLNWSKYAEQVKAKYLPLQVEEIVKLENEFKKTPSVAAADSLAVQWDAKEQFGLAAWYKEEKAKMEPNEKNYIDAAYRYFDAYKVAESEAERAAMVQASIRNYTTVLKLNPANLNAQCDLGILYAEGTNDPMKGIMMLREVVKKDSLHENAQMNLGLLSMKSNQFVKAIDRFKTVLTINPGRIETYIYNAQAYLALNDTMQAKESFKLFLANNRNKELQQQVEGWLKELE
ncbi:MAG: tetratricopeptide repeat protein [Bacteroidetes bacterium]|nr:tetratricopeptide repeat protein [Bacteroidota bacterium]